MAINHIGNRKHLTLDNPVCHYLPGDVDVISQKLLANPV